MNITYFMFIFLFFNLNYTYSRNKSIEKKQKNEDICKIIDYFKEICVFNLEIEIKK